MTAAIATPAAEFPCSFGCSFAGDWPGFLAHARTHDIPHPADRDAWLRSRRTFIGASEVSSIVGANPYAGPLEVWTAKVLPRPEKPFSPIPVRGGGELVMRSDAVGTMLERHLLDDFARRHRRSYQQPATRRHPAFPWLAATPDAELDTGDLVQVKVVGVHVAPDWDDGPPFYTQLQVQTELFVWGRERVTLLALFGSELREYPIAFDPTLVDPVMDILSAFWPYVERRRVPIDFDLRSTNDDTLKWLWPRPAGEVLRRSTGPHLAELVKLARSYDRARAAEKEAKGEKETLGVQLKALVGEAPGFYWGPSAKKPEGKVTWLANKAGVDSAALAQALLEKFVPVEERAAWERRFMEPVGSRTLRVTIKEPHA